MTNKITRRTALAGLAATAAFPAPGLAQQSGRPITLMHGFTPGGPRPSCGFGLTTMRERAQAMGGDLTIESDPGHGTLVEVNLP